MTKKITLQVMAALLCGLFTANAPVSAQCPAGEVEVSINVLTDDFGYETYWELTPNVDPCGTNTIFSGGNFTIGCGGGGAQAQNMTGYGNNLIIPTGPWCLTMGGSYSIHVIDDWGDGAADFQVFVEGGLVAEFDGDGANSTFTFLADPPPARDMSVEKILTPQYGFAGTDFELTCVIKNLGADQVNTMDLNYSVNGGAPVTIGLTALTMNSGDENTITHSTTWQPSNSGQFIIEMWASNINGQSDLDPSNDIGTKTFVINEPVPDLTGDLLTNPYLIEVVANINQEIQVPRDLDFHPDHARMELWVINKDVPGTGGSTVTFHDVGSPGMTHEWKRDGNAWHFMSLPTGIAMGDNDNFATSPGIFDANHTGGSIPFTGPSLWSTDLSIYAEPPPPGGNGSHLDMLHVNPESQGIAHEYDNKYWVVDGFNGDVVMNDFKEDHGPGQHYHGDAIVHRYADFTITKDPNDHIVSHAELDKNTGWLYVVDHGGQRIMRLDINSGTVGGNPPFASQEQYVEYAMVTGYNWEEIINTGLVEPAGIDVIEDKLLVSDHSNGDIIVYDISDPSFPELGRVHTNSPGIMGITVGPAGDIWAVNATTHELIRVVPDIISGVEEQAADAGFTIHPNPSTDIIQISAGINADPMLQLEVLDLSGRVLRSEQPTSTRWSSLDVGRLPGGSYLIRVHTNSGMEQHRFQVMR